MFHILRQMTENTSCSEICVQDVTIDHLKEPFCPYVLHHQDLPGFDLHMIDISTGVTRAVNTLPENYDRDFDTEEDEHIASIFI